MEKDNPAWRWAIGTFLVARVAYSVWAAVVVQSNPVVVANLNLFGAPVVAAFDLRTSARAVFSRELNGRELHFRAAPPNLTDVETGSVWDFSGRAISGALVGTALSQSLYDAEDVFPYRGVAASSNPLLAPWQRFDTNWYLKIAQRGYAERADDGSTVYFPLYPMLIRAVGMLLLGNELLAALLVSNLALLGVFYLLYQTANELVGERAAARTLASFIFFPTAFFLFVAYTESLFLLFALASLREGSKAHWGCASVWGAFAALTRLQGVLLVVPLVYLWWKWGAGSRPQVAGSRQAGVTLLLIPLATAAFLTWQYIFVGNASLVDTYASQLYARFVMPWENLAASIALMASGKVGMADALNLAATILFALMLIPVWRKMPREFMLYALLMFLAPLFRMTTTQPLVSMSRYVLALFPVFIVWGAWANNAWVNRAVVYLSFPLNLYLSAQFMMWGWVA